MQCINIGILQYLYNFLKLNVPVTVLDDMHSGKVSAQRS